MAVWQVAIIFNLMCYCNTTASYQKPPLSTSIYIYIYIYIYIMRGSLHSSGSDSRNRLVGKCSCVLFSSHNIYSALLQRIEHCSTRKSTCRLPIYMYIYIYIYLDRCLFLFLFFLILERKEEEEEPSADSENYL